MANFAYAIVGKTLPIMVREKTDKKAAIWIVLHTDHVDHFSVSADGKFNDKAVFPILAEDGGFNRIPLAKYGKAVDKIEEIFSLKGRYCYRGVLLRGGFISEAMADLFSVTAFDAKSSQFGITVDLSYDDKAALMSQLLGSGQINKMSGFVLGAQSTSQNTTAPTVDVDAETV